MVPWEFEIPQTCGMEHFQGVPLELKKGEFAEDFAEFLHLFLVLKCELPPALFYPGEAGAHYYGDIS
jgi:hypothetical protein